ncbi:MAG: YdbL family protein [Planctomycetota bacterium]|nr:YdbL family protein [Planctomycetota bacterium]
MRRADATKRLAKGMAAGILLLGVLSCGDINVYITFEAPKAEKAIKAINDQVYGSAAGKDAVPVGKEKKDGPGGKASGEEQGFRCRPIFPLIGAGIAWAGEADIKIETPAIKALNRKRAERLPQLNAWKDKGAIGEAMDGYVARVPGSKLDSIKETKEVNDLVSAENQDRKQIMQELLKANKWPAEDLPKLQELFAKDMRERAAKGHWIQNPDGKWVRKEADK